MTENVTKGKDLSSKYPLLILLVLILPTMFLSACAGLNGQPAQPKPGKDELTQLNRDYFSPRVIAKYNCLGGNKDLSQSFCKEGDTSCEDYNLRIEHLNNCEKNLDKQKIYRNQVINGRLYVIDHYYRVFIKKVQGERGAGNIGADLLVLGLNTAGIISSTKQLKDIFAALSLGVTGAKLSFDKNLYFEQTMPALVSQMDALRNEQLVLIRRSMKLDTPEYGLTDAFLDIRNYILAGTIVGAVIGIGESAGEQNAQAKKQLKQLVVPYQSDDSSEVIDNFWRPAGVFNASNEKEILKWLKDNKIEYVPIQAFIVGEPYEELRKKAVVDLKLPR